MADCSANSRPSNGVRPVLSPVDEPPEEEYYAGMALRSKLLVCLGVALIALGLGVDWPPQTDSSLPSTKSLFLFLGGAVGISGLVIGLTRNE